MTEAAASLPAVRWNGVCNRAEFDDEALAAQFWAIHPGRGADHAVWPAMMLHRKAWEEAKTALAFRHFGALGPDATLLSAAGGREPLAYYLTNYARWVFLTDLYGGSEFASPGDTAEAGILTDPVGFAAPDLGPWHPGRLVVEHMDATNLRFEDGTFDGAWSLSSIEHMGGVDGATRALAEMVRVTRPGGIVVAITECVVNGAPPMYSPGLSLFSPEDLAEMANAVAGDAELVEPFSLAGLDSDPGLVIDLAHEVVLDRSGLPPTLPHILLDPGAMHPVGAVFTSAMLVFRRRWP